MAILTEATMKQVNINKFSKLVILTLLFIFGYSTCVSGARIKDIASFKGVRSNQLIGYGLVIGLNGTGDGNSTQFTTQTLANMMEHLGIHTLPEKIKVDNVAGVIVTANLPPFSKKGSTLDVLVSSIGDATSLQGGTLVMNPLRALTTIFMQWHRVRSWSEVLPLQVRQAAAPRKIIQQWPGFPAEPLLKES
jgi:hypothetical protein